MKTWYVMDFEYSQTDKTTACIHALNETEARKIGKRIFPNARYANVVRVIHDEYIIQA